MSIHELFIDNKATYKNIFAHDVTCHDLTCTGTIYTPNISASGASFSLLTVGTGVFGNILVGSLTGGSGTFNVLQTNVLNSDEINSEIILTETVAATTGAFDYIAVNNFTGGNGFFRNLTALTGTIIDITTTVLYATGAYIDFAVVGTGVVGDLFVTYLTGDRGSFNNLDVTNLNTSNFTGIVVNMASGIFGNMTGGSLIANTLRGNLQVTSGDYFEGKRLILKDSTLANQTTIYREDGAPSALIGFPAAAPEGGEIISFLDTYRLIYRALTGSTNIDTSGTTGTYIISMKPTVNIGTGTFNTIIAGTAAFDYVGAVTSNATNAGGDNANYTTGIFSSLLTLSLLTSTGFGFTGNIARIGSVFAESLTGNTGSFNNFRSNSIIAATATITNLIATTGDVTTLSSNSLIAGTATIANLIATAGSVTTLSSNSLIAGTATITNLIATTGTVSTLKSDSIVAGAMTVNSNSNQLILGLTASNVTVTAPPFGLARTLTIPTGGSSTDQFLLGTVAQTVSNKTFNFTNVFSLTGATLSTTMSGPWAVAQSVTFTFSLLGNRVSVNVPDTFAVASVAGQQITIVDPAPTGYRPATTKTVIVLTFDNGIFLAGRMNISTTGNMIFLLNGATVTYTGAGNTGFRSTNFTYDLV
jgi:hypothetical protein